MLNRIREIIEEGDFEYYGLRADDAEYKIGDICRSSHQLLQDPEFDDDSELIYPYIDDKNSPYYGYYDAGELDGTCAIKVDEDSIEEALESIEMYDGKHVYLIAGDYIECGNDEGEIIIEDAEVLEAVK